LDGKDEAPDADRRYPDLLIPSLRFKKSKVVADFPIARKLLMVLIEIGAIFVSNRVPRKTADFCYTMIAAVITNEIPDGMEVHYNFKGIMTHAHLMHLFCPEGILQLPLI